MEQISGVFELNSLLIQRGFSVKREAPHGVLKNATDVNRHHSSELNTLI